MIKRRQLLAQTALLGLAGLLPITQACSQVVSGTAFTPETFGAKGDGTSDDTLAFQRMAAAVNSAGGGRIVLRRATYRVGRQGGPSADGHYGHAPADVLRLIGCTRPLSIEGNGAVLSSNPGMRYGNFDTGGRVDTRPQPFYGRGGLATPYDYMILIAECSGPVTISNLELDGQSGSLKLGGPWGDTGWQVPAVGLFLRGNSGDETITNLKTHHHAQDGIMIAGPRRDQAGAVKRIVGLVAEDNGRQGCSLIGGRDYLFEDCRFARTGRTRIASAPAAGVDLEAETAPIRAIRFVRCEFLDNGGCGLLAESGDIADVQCSNCRLVGTTTWSAWPNKPLMRFVDSTFIGAMVNPFGSDDPAQAAQFERCRFSDDPAGYRSIHRPGPLADLGERRNVLFRQCEFEALHGARLPWSTAAIFEDCTMRQNSREAAYPRGQYRGRNRIDGAVDIGASSIEGSLVINGRTLGPRR